MMPAERPGVAHASHEHVPLGAPRFIVVEQRRVRFAVAAVLVPLLVFGALCVLGGRSFFVFPDAQVQTYAWMQKLTHSLYEGHLPLWDPNTLSGHPIAGELLAGILYPLNALWAALFGAAGGISARALDGLVLLHFSLAGLGMFLLLDAWSLPPPASAFGAVVFACLGALPLRAPDQPDIFYGLCVTPWVLWAATRHLAGGSPGAAILAGVFLALQLLAGHAQPTIHTAVLLVALAIGTSLHRTESFGRRCWLVVRAGALIGASFLVVAGPQLYLSGQYFSNAYRWVSAPEPIRMGEHVPFDVFGYRHMLEPEAFASLIDPWNVRVDDANTLYFGTVPLVLVVWFLASRRARASVGAFAVHGPWLLCVAVGALVCALGHHTFASAVLRVVPVLSAVRELGRYVVLFHFSMSVLAAMAFSALLERGMPGISWRPVFWLVAILVIVQLIWMVRGPGDTLSRAAVAQLAVALIVIAACCIRSSRSAAPAAVAVALLINTVAFSDLVLHRAAEGQDADSRFAGGPVATALDGTWGRARADVVASAPLPANYAEAHRFQAKLGHGATMYAPYFEFLGRDWSEDSPVNDLLNVRYLVTGDERPLPLVSEDPARGLKVYERAHWYPRVFLRSAMTPRPDGAAIERAIGLTVEQYDDHLQRFRVTAPGPDEAIVSEIAYPGWCATVNGVTTPIARAKIDGVETPLRAVPVQAGENVLEFRYRPFPALLFGCK